jgi:hypothetical protein
VSAFRAFESEAEGYLKTGKRVKRALVHMVIFQ